MVVHARLTWREKAALTLDRLGRTRPAKHLARGDIPKIRRLRDAGLSRQEIMAALGIDMSDACFKRRCAEVSIKFDRIRKVGPAIDPRRSVATDWDRHAARTLLEEEVLKPKREGP